MAPQLNALPPLRAALPQVLYQFCLARGLSEADLLRDAGVSRSAVADPDGWIPYERGLALWDALISSASGEPIGVHFGAAVGFVDLGVVGLAAAHASTIAEAFETFAPLRHLVDPLLELELSEEPAGRTLVVSSHPGLLQRVHPMEAMLVSTNTGLGRLTQLPVQPSRVEFAAAPCGPSELYLERFGVLPSVTQRYSLTYPSDVWQLPIAGAHPLVLKYLVEHGLNQAEPPREPHSSASRVEQWLRNSSGAEGQPTLLTFRVADAASALATSRRDLQRRLGAEGTSFHQLQEKIARERAHALLQRPDVSIAEVAYALGYAEPRSFQRACYRWFKAGPGAHRAKSARGQES